MTTAPRPRTSAQRHISLSSRSGWHTATLRRIRCSLAGAPITRAARKVAPITFASKGDGAGSHPPRIEDDIEGSRRSDGAEEIRNEGGVNVDGASPLTRLAYLLTVSIGLAAPFGALALYKCGAIPSVRACLR